MLRVAAPEGAHTADNTPCHVRESIGRAISIDMTAGAPDLAALARRSSVRHLVPRGPASMPIPIWRKILVR